MFRTCHLLFLLQVGLKMVRWATACLIAFAAVALLAQPLIMRMAALFEGVAGRLSAVL